MFLCENDSSIKVSLALLFSVEKYPPSFALLFRLAKKLRRFVVIFQFVNTILTQQSVRGSEISHSNENERENGSKLTTMGLPVVSIGNIRVNATQTNDVTP